MFEYIKEKKNIFIIAGIILVVILIAFFYFRSVATVPVGIILFYGQGCSHCKIVDDFITQNNIEQKVKFTKLEVWYNKDNQAILIQAAQKCGISSDSVGIPLLYDGQNCYVGDADVINFFKTQAGIK